MITNCGIGARDRDGNAWLRRHGPGNGRLRRHGWALWHGLEYFSYTYEFAGMRPDILTYARAGGHDAQVAVPCIVDDMPDQLLAQFVVLVRGKL